MYLPFLCLAQPVYSSIAGNSTGLDSFATLKSV